MFAVRSSCKQNRPRSDLLKSTRSSNSLVSVSALRRSDCPKHSGIIRTLAQRARVAVDRRVALTQDCDGNNPRPSGIRLLPAQLDPRLDRAGASVPGIIEPVPSPFSTSIRTDRTCFVQGEFSSLEPERTVSRRLNRKRLPVRLRAGLWLSTRHATERTASSRAWTPA